MTHEQTVCELVLYASCIMKCAFACSGSLESVQAAVCVNNIHKLSYSCNFSKLNLVLTTFIEIF